MSSEVLFNQRHPLEMPITPLGDLISIQSGYAFKSNDYTSHGHFLIRIGNVQDGEIRLDNAKYVTLDKRTTSFELVEGDILTSLTGNIGRVARIENDHLPAALNQRVARLIVKDERKLDCAYLYHALSSSDFREKLAFDGGGAAQQNVSPKAIAGIAIPHPSIDEQRRIAEVLRSVDEAIAAQSALCTHLRQTTDNLANELYEREIAASDANLTAYGDACETVQVGIVVKPASYYVDEGGVPALRSTNIKRNEIDFSALVQLSHEGHEFNRKSSLRVGDVVTIRTGEPGKTAVISQDAPSPLNCIDIIFSRPKPHLRPRFAAYFINSTTARTQIAAMQGGLAQQHFNVGEMKKLKMPVPELVRQDEVIEVLDAAWQSVHMAELQLASLQAMKGALMSDLLSGRVRVSA